MTKSSSERAINKFNASLNNLQLYNYQDTGGLLLLRQFLCDTTNVMSINKNWRGAAPYHIPPEKHWHKTAISIIERAFREKWKYGTIATVVKSTGAHALPTPHPKQHTTALLFAAVTIELVKWVVHNNYPVQKALIKIKESASAIEKATEERRVKRRSLCQGASEYAATIKKSRPPLAVFYKLPKERGDNQVDVGTVK